MTSSRSYRGTLPDEVAISELQNNAGIQFDPELVKVFIAKVVNSSSIQKRQNDGEEKIAQFVELGNKGV